MAKERRSSSFRWVFRNLVQPEPDTAAIGFLSFEITALMSKLVLLWNRLQDSEFTTVKQNLSSSTGIKKLISDDEQFLMELFMKEIVEDLQYIAKSIVRFGPKCSDPVLHEFEKFVTDPLKNEFNWFGWQYKWKKMDRRVKKMQRFIVLAAELTREMEIVAEIERHLRRKTAIFAFAGGKRHSFKYRKKISWHRRHVQSLKLTTPWNRTYDYIVRLFMRSMITIIERIKIVFGVKEIRRLDYGGEKSADRLVPVGSCRRSELEEQGKKQSNNHCPPLMKISSEIKKAPQFSHFPSFRDCKDGGIGSTPPLTAARQTLPLTLKNRAPSSPRRTNGGHYSISSFFIKENLSNPPPNSLGAAALAIHYSKIVISIERLASAPHLITAEDRHELFNMLPASIRKAVRTAAKFRHPPLYNPDLAAEWKSAMGRIFQWLAPMARDMETWHSEQSIEKQPDGADTAADGGGSRSHVLLLQTFHYADREKTEGAIVELLVALSNICSSGQIFNM
ncbi:Protein PSK SIMULATOR 1, partial [Cucurbita argyrosperma subsp. sororia]